MNDHGGVFAFLLGIVALVFAGVGLSLVAEKRLSYGSSRSRLEEQIAKDALTATELQARLDPLRNRLGAGRNHLADQPEEIDAARQRWKDTEAAADRLESRAADLRSEAEALQTAYTDYRDEYRDQARNDARGMELAVLRLPGGRTFESVTIRNIDDDGLRIQHATGSARIPFSDLPDDWKERLDWSPGEREPAPEAAEESSSPEPPAAEPPARKKRASPRPPRTQPSVADPGAVESLRTRLIHLRTTRNATARQLEEARTNSGRGQQSVPGSLETWAERAIRLEAALAKARIQHDLARARLAAASPGDPLLSDSPPY